MNVFLQSSDESLCALCFIQAGEWGGRNFRDDQYLCFSAPEKRFSMNTLREACRVFKGR